jgi:hypothetical protein
MEEATYPTFTAGGNIAIRELAEKTKWMRGFRGAAVCPVVSLSDTFMNTKFGGRQRPHFIIRSWISLGGGGEELPALPSPDVAPNKPAEPVKAAPEPVAAKTAESAKSNRRRQTLKSRSFAVGDTVAPPSLREEMNDDMPF